jgi:hypothetical protein
MPTPTHVSTLLGRSSDDPWQVAKTTSPGIGLTLSGKGGSEAEANCRGGWKFTTFVPPYAQRQEHLPVREPRRQLVAGVRRERRLADAGHPADRVDAHRPPEPAASASCASSGSRPVNEVMSRGSLCVAAAAPPAGRAVKGQLSPQDAGDRRAQRRGRPDIPPGRGSRPAAGSRIRRAHTAASSRSQPSLNSRVPRLPRGRRAYAAPAAAHPAAGPAASADPGHCRTPRRSAARRPATASVAGTRPPSRNAGTGEPG